jgi:DNA helicase-2/ATP-dependent DNA helicase PcrA
LFNKIKSLNEINKNLTLKDLLNKFDLHAKYNIWISRQILKKSESNIEILTAHSSKWLEYDYIYIPGVFGGNWEWKTIPNKLKLPLWVAWNWLQFAGLDEKALKNIEKETQLQEDRRLFFVAMTRAKKELVFTRPAWKDNKPYIDSPFIIETGIEWKLLENKVDDEAIVNSIKSELLWKTNNLVKVSSEEINYISEFLENYKLSPTDLNTFLEDPKEFLKNVVFKYPFTWNEFTIFGNVYHRVLELATMKKMIGEDVELWYMTETFLYLLDKQVLTAEEKDRLTKKWLEWLTGYFEWFSNSSRTPLAVEYNFRSRDVVFSWVRITGKIDKVEKIGDSLNSWKGEWQWALFVEDVAVVDYKTWGIKTEWKIKWLDRYWNKKESFSEWRYYRQLLFYKLLAESDPEFSSRFNVTELALDFVEWKNWDYKYVWIIPENDDYEDFKELVKDSWEKINSLEFWEEVLR